MGHLGGHLKLLTDSKDNELPDIAPLDWRGIPLATIYDLNNICVVDSEFIPTLHSSIVLKCLVVVRYFPQF